MFFLIRIFSLLIFFIYRKFPFLQKHSYQTNAYGLSFKIADYGIRNKNITNTKIIIPVDSKIFFKIQKENALTRFFKKWGLTSELQTSDLHFDQQYYIASDNIGFLKQLKNHSQFFNLIKELLKSNSIEISCNSKGELIIEGLNLNADLFLNQNISTILLELKRNLETLSNNSIFKVDPYNATIYLFEFISSIALFYGFTSFVEYQIVKTYYFLSSPLVLKYIFSFSAIYILIMLILFFVLVGKSARSPIIFLSDMALNIICSFFIASGFMYDINVKLDKSEPIEYKTKITDKFTERKRFSRKNKSYKYYLIFSSATSETIPSKLSVNLYDYGRFEINNNVAISVKNGFLKIPYVTEINKIN